MPQRNQHKCITLYVDAVATHKFSSVIAIPHKLTQREKSGFDQSFMMYWNDIEYTVVVRGEQQPQSLLAMLIRSHATEPRVWSSIDLSRL